MLIISDTLIIGNLIGLLITAVGPGRGMDVVKARAVRTGSAACFVPPPPAKGVEMDGSALL